MDVLMGLALFLLSGLLGGSLSIDFLDNDLAKVCRPVDRPLDILFILDGSGSVGGSTFDTQIKMLNRIIDLVDIGEEKSRISVMQYSSYTYVEFLFNTYKDKGAIRANIQNIHPKLGTTKTGKCIPMIKSLKNTTLHNTRTSIVSTV